MRRRLIAILLAVAFVLVLSIVIWLIIRQDIPAANLPLNETGRPIEVSPTGGETVPPMDVEAVLRAYFARWSAGDAAGMDALRIPEDRGQHAEDDLAYIASVDLVSLRQMPESLPESLASSDVYAAALFEADFIVHYNEAGQETFLRESVEHSGYRFWLTQQTGDSPWLIAMQGY